MTNRYELHVQKSDAIKSGKSQKRHPKGSQNSVTNRKSKSTNGSWNTAEIKGVYWTGPGWGEGALPPPPGCHWVQYK